jgi:hypothetical protein
MVKEGLLVSSVASVGESDPEPINCRPFITGNPPCTIVRSDGVIIDLAVDYSSSAHHGRMYLTWQDHADNPYSDDLILLSRSDDGGLTWSPPQRVNQTPAGTFTDQAFEPAVHVNADGVVAVSYARGYFVGDYQGLDSQGTAFRPLFTLASPGSDTVFPNPNPTDVFINAAF